MCPLHTSRSVCDTWTLSPVQKSLRITCGWSTVRAKSLNPTGEFVFVCVRLEFSLGVLFCDISFSLYIFPVYLVIFCTFHLCCHSSPSLSCVMCSSVQLHSSLEGDWEYLLLEECESKPLPPQTSLWVASWNCLLVWSATHVLKKRQINRDTQTLHTVCCRFTWLL